MTEPTIICDSREQRPWVFPPEIAVVRGTLREGDYSVVGIEDAVRIERKSLGDFVQTCILEWNRFAKELHRLMAYDKAAIIVEANASDILNHRYESQATPASVEGRMNQCFFDYGIPVYLWGSHEESAAMALRWLKLAFKRYGR